MPDPEPQVIIPLKIYERLTGNQEMMASILKDGANTAVALSTVKKLIDLIVMRIKDRPEITRDDIIKHLNSFASDREGLLACLKEEIEIASQ